MNQFHGAYTGKRIFDLSILVASIPLTLPVGLAVAATIRLTDGSPVLFKQARAGLNGNEFHVFKFRTMSFKSGENGAILPDRERLTAIGKFLRKSSLDELPQLINIARREMSVVGPRPLFPRYVPYYTARESARLLTLPGITGLAQVSGRNTAGWRDRLELDAQYAEAPTLWKDIKILVQTALKVIRSDGVSIIAGETGDPLDLERSFPSDSGLHLRRLYPRDLELRVQWMSDNRTRKHMNLPEAVSIESTKSWYRSTLHDPNRHEFAIEDEYGRVLAMSGLRANSLGSPSEFYIFVAPDCQSRGIGQIATELTLNQAKRLGTIPSVTLTVSKENSRALHIYRRLGFKSIDSNDSRIRMEIKIGNHSVSD